MRQPPANPEIDIDAEEHGRSRAEYGFCAFLITGFALLFAGAAMDFLASACGLNLSTSPIVVLLPGSFGSMLLGVALFGSPFKKHNQMLRKAADLGLFPDNSDSALQPGRYIAGYRVVHDDPNTLCLIRIGGSPGMVLESLGLLVLALLFGSAFIVHVLNVGWVPAPKGASGLKMTFIFWLMPLLATGCLMFALKKRPLGIRATGVPAAVEAVRVRLGCVESSQRFTAAEIEHFSLALDGRLKVRPAFGPSADLIRIATPPDRTRGENSAQRAQALRFYGVLLGARARRLVANLNRLWRPLPERPLIQEV